MGKLDGKITLVTGGTEGMKSATALEFVAEGAFAFVAGRRQAEVDKTVAKPGENAPGGTKGRRSAPGASACSSRATSSNRRS